jgi:hypothetical protein
MNKLYVKVYGKPRYIEKEYASFKEALSAAQIIADSISLVIPLTRNSSVNGPIAHMDIYSDMYNECAITINVPL